MDRDPKAEREQQREAVPHEHKDIPPYTDEEKAWVDAFIERMGVSSPEEDAFYAALKARRASCLVPEAADQNSGSSEVKRSSQS